MDNKNIKTYLNQQKTSSFCELLFSFIDKSGHKDSEVYKRVDIDRRLFSKIRCNNNYIPKKDNIIKLCLSLSLDKEDTMKLLNSAGYTLSTNNDFDLVLLYCLENNIYNIDTVNEYLYDYTNTALI